mmetsp:Transcript_68968/g.152106  ORF Transcript_68968/g.152106 Transcript_68968/m.152106 type:complete len:255 (-) Transcript_68968:727-1491(-)
MGFDLFDVVEVRFLFPVVPFDALFLHQIDLFFPACVVGAIHSLPFLQCPNCLIISMKLSKDDAFSEFCLVPSWIDLKGSLSILQNLFQLKLLGFEGQSSGCSVGQGDVAVGIALQGAIIALHSGAVLALSKVGITFGLLFDCFVVPQAIQNHLLVRIVRRSAQVVVTFYDKGPGFRRLLRHVKFQNGPPVLLLNVPPATPSPNAAAQLALQNRRVWVALQPELHLLSAKRHIERKGIRHLIPLISLKLSPFGRL